MPVHKIQLLGSPALREPAQPVEVFDDDLKQLVRDMFETMYQAQGIGLAGPQIGVSQRVVVLDVEEEGGTEANRVALVNPEVVRSTKKAAKSTEGCLSIPGAEGVVERPVSVVVEARDPDGEPVRLEADGLFSRALQHEIDHLDGILFIDRLSPLKRQLLIKKWKKSQAEAAVS